MEFIQKRELEKHEGSMLEKLEKFRSKICQTKSHSTTDSEWSTHKLKFHIDSDNAYKYISKVANARDFDDGGLQVIDEPGSNLKRKGIDIDELYKLTKESDWVDHYNRVYMLHGRHFSYKFWVSELATPY